MRQLSLHGRVRRPERMDQPGLPAAEHCRALAALGRINGLSRAAAPLWREILALARQQRLASLRVLDLASGGGDLGLRLVRRARRHGLELSLTGGDVSPVAVQFARRQAQRHGLSHLEYLLLDALADPLPADCDVVMCSLFLHHLDEAQAVALLARMAAAARRLLLVDDLLRCRLGYAAAWLGCRLFTRSPVVRFDGPVSVAAAFTLDEVAGLCRQAGLHGVRAAPHWPWRFLLSWKKPA